MSFDNAWNKLTAWLKTNAPLIFQSINPPANSDEIQKASESFGHKFPADLTRLYELANGTDLDSFLFLGHQFGSLEQIHEAWESWKQEGIDCSEEDEHVIVETVDAIQPKYFHESWLPISPPDRYGLAVDFAPGPNGTAGQIMNYGDFAHSYHRYVFAESITEFIERMVHCLQSGIVILDMEESDGLNLVFAEKVSEYQHVQLDSARGFELFANA